MAAVQDEFEDQAIYLMLSQLKSGGKPDLLEVAKRKGQHRAQIGKALTLS